MKYLTRKEKEGWLLISVFILFGIIYTYHLTTAGLWYDEGIEYFYSKYMSGPVPVNVMNPMWKIGYNMYERICLTFQPPLYNIIMYFWLLLFDSESGFRMAGVVTTFIGAIGFYLALRRMSNYKWGLLGLCIYLSTSVIFFYALECGEYNLMLCMECWTLYFFTECAQHPQNKASWKKLILFFLFAVLSIYSQYGAALFVISIFIALCYFYIKRREFVSLKRFFTVGISAFVIAIIPLLVFFLRIQLTNQGTDVADHSPVFVGSLFGGIPYSLFISLYEQIIWIFSTALSWGWSSFYIMLLTIFTLFILTTIALFLKSKTPILVPLVLSLISSYIIFFILSAFSYYSYNNWDGRLGCYNIIHQTRYVLFLVPPLLFTLIIGVICVYNHFRYKKLLRSFVILLLVVFTFNLVWSLKNCRIKSYEREVILSWIEKKDCTHKIVVQEFVAPTFLFYVQHSPIYPEIRDAIIITDQNMRYSDKIESYLRNLGIMSLSSFYYIGNKDATGMKNREGIRLIYDIFTKHGYKVEKVCGEIPTLLYISK